MLQYGDFQPISYTFQDTVRAVAYRAHNGSSTLAHGSVEAIPATTNMTEALQQRPHQRQNHHQDSIIINVGV